MPKRDKMPVNPKKITKAEQAVLTAARRYGAKAADKEYSDEEEGKLLGLAYDYANLLRLATWSPKKAKAAAVPPRTLDMAMLSDPEVILRVKRRVGPLLWGAVKIVLEETRRVLEAGLDKPDPLAPKENSKAG